MWRELARAQCRKPPWSELLVSSQRRQSPWRTWLDETVPAQRSVLLRGYPLLRTLQLFPPVCHQDLVASSLGEGAHYRRLVEHQGVTVFLCDESSAMTTGTYKDLDACLITSVHRGRGSTALVLSSAGNLGRALAVYGARAGLQVYLFHPRSTQYKLCGASLRQPGIHPIAVDLPEPQVKSLARAFAARYALPHVPEIALRIAASAARALFLLEQAELHGAPLDCIAQVVCAAYGPIGIYTCLRELVARGLLPASRVPRFLGFQQAANAPMVRAWREGAEQLLDRHCQAVPENYLEPGLYNTRPQSTYGPLREILTRVGGDLRSLDHEAYARHRDTVLGWFEACGLQFTRGPEGIVEKAGILTGVGIAQAIEDGVLRQGENVAYLLTGGLGPNEPVLELEPSLSIDASRSEAGWLQLLGEHFGLTARQGGKA